MSSKPKGETKVTLPKKNIFTCCEVKILWMCGFSLTLLSLKPKGEAKVTLPKKNIFTCCEVEIHCILFVRRVRSYKYNVNSKLGLPQR